MAVEVRELFALASEDDQGKEFWLGLKVDGDVEKGRRGVVAVLEPRQEKGSEEAAKRGEANVVGVRELELNGVLGISEVEPFTFESNWN